ncbi:serine/threonine-protein kinase, partial [Xanthobacter wiegelii]|uniref:hypothetical protein n=1 Tax=Xanthobacter wiegelii TaxID=3119913 RepID=UPI00372A4078
EPAAREPARAEAPRPDQARLQALKAEFAASTPKMDAPKIDSPKIDSPKIDSSKIDAPKIDAPRIETAPADAPKVEALKAEPEDAPPAVSEASAKLEDLSHRLDAALVHPEPAAAAPQISLSDLLGDEPAAAEPAPAPRAEPVIEPPPPPRGEGPLSRFLYQSRTRAAETRGAEPRPEPRATDVRPTEPRARVDAPLRTETPRPEAPLRPREFSFRPAGEGRPLPPPAQPRREPLALRDVNREEGAGRPDVASPLLRAPSPTATPVSTDIAAPVIHAPAPSVTAPVQPAPAVAAPSAGDAPNVEPETPRDPLDDFDAEMASLLGRTNARSR